MKTNEVRWKLHCYTENKKMIEQYKTYLAEYRLMDGIKAQVITDMPIQRSTTSRTESTALNRMEYIAELENILDDLMRVSIAIESVYCYLKEPARTIIEMRYFIKPQTQDVRQRKYNWFEISVEVDRNEDYCRAIDCKVVRKIQNKILGGK